MDVFRFYQEPWWEREFHRARRGILRELHRAGLMLVGADGLTKQLLRLALRELARSNGEMTVEIFRRTVVRLTHDYIERRLHGANEPVFVSIAWRAKYSGISTRDD